MIPLPCVLGSSEESCVHKDEYVDQVAGLILNFTCLLRLQTFLSKYMLRGKWHSGAKHSGVWDQCLMRLQCMVALLDAVALHSGATPTGNRGPCFMLLQRTLAQVMRPAAYWSSRLTFAQSFVMCLCKRIQVTHAL